MNLHEYQAKQLFTKYNLPVPQGEVALNAEEALGIASKLGGNRWVVKAQVHAGGRGKAGGVRIVNSRDDLTAAVKALINTRLVTYQTDEHGQPVNQVLIEQPCNIDRELYLGAVIDRSTRRIVFMASTEGGVDIETVAEKTPEKILRVTVDPLLGVLPFQGRNVGFALGLNAEQLKQFTQILINLSKMFVQCDLSLLEVNPLVVTKEGHLLCLDGKINIDDNALYRHPALRAMRDATQEDARENRAREWELN